MDEPHCRASAGAGAREEKQGNMALSINTNVAALTVQRNLVRTGGEFSRSLERLSSGLRINSARDDAAGLAISTRMTSGIRGMNQAMRNANDGISMLQTADGALDALTTNIQRIRELAVQAANETNNDSDRQAIAVEVKQRLAEIDRIADQARFNGQKIFASGGGSIGGNAAQRAVDDGLRMGWLANSEKMILEAYGIQGDGAALQIDITQDSDGSAGYAAFVASTGGGAGGRGTNLRMSIDMANFTPANLPNGGSEPFYNDRVIAHEMVHAVMARATNWTSLTSTSEWFVEGAAEFIHGADERVAIDIAAAAGATQADKIDTVVDTIASWGGQSVDYSAGYIGTRYLHDKLLNAGFEGGIKDFMVHLNGASAPTMDQAMTHFFGGGYTQASFLAELQADSGNGQSNGVVFVLNKMNLTNADTGAIGGLDADGGGIRTADNVVANAAISYGDDVLKGFTETWEQLPSGHAATRKASMQIGSEVGQTMDVSIGSASLEALGLTDIDIADSSFGAARAIVHLDEALEYLNSQRAVIGAQLGRFDSSIANLQVAIGTASEARSRVMDTDYAAEMATMTRTNLLREAGVAIAAQANADPRRVLSLLSNL